VKLLVENRDIKKRSKWERENKKASKMLASVGGDSHPGLQRNSKLKHWWESVVPRGRFELPTKGL
jgi:hypothetical protein